MTGLRELEGRPVIAKESAENLGAVAHVLVVDRHVQAIHVTGSRSGVVPWDDIDAIGDDAVVVGTGDVVREPSGDDEERSARGDLAMVGKRVLDAHGDDRGVVTDVEFDPDDGTIRRVDLAETSVSGDRLLGVGSYAVVVAADDR